MGDVGVKGFVAEKWRRRATESIFRHAEKFAGKAVAAGVALVVAVARVQAEPEPGLAIGFDALRWQSDAEIQADFDDFAHLGVRWLRTDLNWAVVQAAGAESFDWSGMDRIVDLAEAASIRVLPVVGSTPAWDWEVPGEPGPPRDMAAFGRFMAAAVARYAPRGIRDWEIWNEPNMASAWGGPPDPATYAALLGAGAAAVRAVDPGARVLFGGLAAVRATGPDGAETEWYSARDFLREAYAAGAAAHFDVMSFHPYTYPRLPDSWLPTGWSLMGDIGRMMQAAGDGAKPIWVTEFGAPTRGEDAVSELDQAETLLLGFTLIEKAGWSGPFLWYSYRDIGRDSEDRESWFGMIGPDDRRKPVYDAFRKLSLPLTGRSP